MKSVLNSAGKRVLYLLATQYHREAIPHTFLAMVKKKFDRGTRSEQVAKAANHLTEALEIQKELKTCNSMALLKLSFKNFCIDLILLKEMKNAATIIRNQQLSTLNFKK